MATSTDTPLFLTRLRWLVAALLLCLPLSAIAEEPSVEAVLETHVAAPGDPVQFEISVQGGSARAPKIEIEGLEIQYLGPQNQQRIELGNRGFQRQESVIHHYLIIPQRAGDFTIPALTLNVDGERLSTQPLKLTVNRGGTSPGGEDNSADPQMPSVFAEWVLPKATLYVGEIIPAELRLYIEQNTRAGMKEMPKVQADGLTLREFPREPSVSRVERDGKRYEVVTFKSALSAAKAGQLKLGDTSISINVQVPERRPSRRMQRQRGFPDIFDDPFFNQFGQPTMRAVTVRAPEVDLTIKPLPTEGRPADFSGAVGQFRLATKASPTEGKAGDPITVTSSISGTGSFSRMQAPTVAKEDGWQIYPPSTRFQADDDIEISGEKTFEQAMIPDFAATALPSISFSYFDPIDGKYVSLKADPVPLKITGTAAAPTPTPAPSAAVAQSTPTATPAATEKDDIRALRAENMGRSVSFTPVWRSPLFLGVQLLPIGALFVGIALQWKMKREANVTLQRRNALRAEKQTALRTLRDTSAPAARFYEEAIKAFQSSIALQSDPGDHHALTAEEICRGRSLDEETVRTIVATFTRFDELHYAGSRETAVTPERRSATLAALNQLEKSHVA